MLDPVVEIRLCGVYTTKDFLNGYRISNFTTLYRSRAKVAHGHLNIPCYTSFLILSCFVLLSYDGASIFHGPRVMGAWRSPVAVIGYQRVRLAVLNASFSC
jgi:hypothetical protein